MQPAICHYFALVLLLQASQLLLRASPVPQWANEESSYHTDTCSLPSEYGNCHSHDRMFYYSRQLKKCLEFEYSSCGGNDNNFSTMEDCIEYCRPESKPLPKPQPQPKPKRGAKKVTGHTKRTAP